MFWDWHSLAVKWMKEKARGNFAANYNPPRFENHPHDRQFRVRRLLMLWKSDPFRVELKRFRSRMSQRKKQKPSVKKFLFDETMLTFVTFKLFGLLIFMFPNIYKRSFFSRELVSEPINFFIGISYLRFSSHSWLLNKKLPKTHVFRHRQRSEAWCDKFEISTELASI